MKKTHLLLMLFAMIQVSFAQQKVTPVTTIGGMTVKILMDQATSKVTITLTGPSTKWISLGLGTTSMSVNKDVITYGTTLLDQHFTTSGHVAPTTDTTNNLTIVSNTVTGNTRTLVVTRALSTGDAQDYAFVYTISSINVVWAIGPSTTVTAEHSTFGSKNLAFTSVLGTENFSMLDKSVVFPNPSTGIFNVTKNSLATISKIRIFDVDAKMVKEINTGFSNENIEVDLSELRKGVYFMEISNETDQTVKKICLN